MHSLGPFAERGGRARRRALKLCSAWPDVCRTVLPILIQGLLWDRLLVPEARESARSLNELRRPRYAQGIVWAKVEHPFLHVRCRVRYRCATGDWQEHATRCLGFRISHRWQLRYVCGGLSAFLRPWAMLFEGRTVPPRNPEDSNLVVLQRDPDAPVVERPRGRWV